MEKRMLKNAAVVLLALITAISSAHAAVYHVTESGSGRMDGSDWENSFAGFSGITWQTISQGDRIYAAGGAYGSLSIAISGTAEANIYVLRATASDHGSSTGWSDAYDRPIMLSQGASINVRGSHVTIDGRSKGGFAVTLPARICGGVGLKTEDGTVNVTVRNVKVESPGDDWGNIAAYIKGSRHVISHCELGDVPNDAMKLFGDGHVIEHSKIGPRNSGVANSCCSGNVCHGDALEIWPSNDVVFRHNWMDYGGDGLHFGIGGGQNSGWEIYGNVFTGAGGTKIRKNSQASNPTGIRIYNNAFYGLYGAISIPGDIQNNVYYMVEHYKPSGATNIDAQEDPFIDIGTRNFRLKPDSDLIDKGNMLEDRFSLDADGNIRGRDGAWDVGAFEYTGACQPSCSGKACGPDGCGGSCGTCGQGYDCIAGTCVLGEDCGRVMLDVIASWKAGHISMGQLMAGISLWKAAC